MSSEDVRLFVAGWISVFGAFAFVTGPSRPSKAIPMFAAFACVIATIAYVVHAIVAFRAIIV